MQTTSQTTPPPLSPVLDPNAPRWPKIIGIFSVVIGSLFFLFSLMRLGGIYVQKLQMTNLVEKGHADAEEVNAVLADMIQLQILSGIVLGVLAVLLVTGGVTLLKRRKISSVLLRVWAIAYLIAGFAIAYIGFPIESQQTKIAVEAAMAESGTGEPAAEKLAGSVAEFGIIFRLTISLIWVLASSIFSLIWFNRRKIREEVKAWD